MALSLYLIGLNPRSHLYSKFIVMFTFLIVYIELSSCKNLKSPSTAIPGSPTFVAGQTTVGELSNSTQQIFNVTLEEIESLSEQEASLLLAKNSFCTCQCCREKLNDVDTCRKKVKAILPEDFKCSKDLCFNVLQSKCNEWKKNKCKKACFCQKCKSKLKPDDKRCSGDLEPAIGCECSTHESDQEKCLPQKEGIAFVWLTVLKAKKNKKYLKCTMGCFCRHCDRIILAKVFKTTGISQTCKAFPTIPSHCKSCPACPTASDANNAKQTLEQLAILHGSHS